MQLLTHDDTTQGHIAYTPPAEFQDGSSVLEDLGTAVAMHLTEERFVLFCRAFCAIL